MPYNQGVCQFQTNQAMLNKLKTFIKYPGVIINAKNKNLVILKDFKMLVQVQ